MSGVRSQRKGKTAEREVIGLLNPYLENAWRQVITDYPDLPVGELPKLQRNTLQADAGGCDIVGLDWLALEVKNQQSNGVNDWWKQCCGQAKKGQTPVLWYRAGGKQWRVRMRVQIPVVAYRPNLHATVDMSPFEWLPWFEIKAYDEFGLRAKAVLVTEQLRENHTDDTQVVIGYR